MRSVETEGETIDEAIENALRTLHVERSQVELHILSDATRGVFGFGGKKARIRATLRAPLARLDEGETVPSNDSRETFRPSTPPIGAGQSSGAPAAAMISGTLAVRSKALLLEILSHLDVSCTVSVRSGEEPGILVLEVSGDSGAL